MLLRSVSFSIYVLQCLIELRQSYWQMGGIQNTRNHKFRNVSIKQHHNIDYLGTSGALA
jgi:hypothetical protein